MSPAKNVKILCIINNYMDDFISQEMLYDEIVLSVIGLMFNISISMITQISNVLVGATANIGEIVTNYVVCIKSNMYYFGCTTITSSQMY